MEKKIKTSVIMCVHNGEKHLKKCIESILEQTFEDFEFLILDDNSSDHTNEIIRNYSQDERIRIFENKKNIGLTKSLNILLGEARGEYVARIDADDIAQKDRLLKQISFLDEKKDLGMAISNCNIIDQDSNLLYTHCPPCNETALKWSLLFRNPIRHSTVVVRMQAFLKTGFYDINFTYAQDYDMWQRIINYYKIGVIPEALSDVRVHEDTITINMVQKQDYFVNLVSRRQMQFYCGRYISLEEAKKIRMVYVHRHQMQIEEMLEIDIEDFNYHVGLYFEIALGFFNSGVDENVLMQEIELDIRSLFRVAKSRPRWAKTILKGMEHWLNKNKKNNEFFANIEKKIVLPKTKI